MRAHVAALRSMAGALEEVQPLNLDEEIDLTGVLGEIRFTVNRFDRERPHVRNPEFWLSHVLDGFYMLLARSDRSTEQRSRAVRGRLSDLPRFLSEARETLCDCPEVFVDTAERIVARTPGLLDAVAEALLDPESMGDAEVLAGAKSALQAFAHHLKGLYGSTEADFAIGEDAFNYRLHYEHSLNATAPELWRYGLHLIEEVEGSIEALAQTLDSGRRWPDLVARLREEHPAASQLVDTYRSEMARAHEFVQSHRIAPLPSGHLDVVATPDYLEPLIPYAAYQPPGAFSSDRRGLFYVTVPEESDPRCRERLMDHSLGEMPATALHEAYPGHHLQISLAQERGSDVRRLVSSAVTVEGWALYCEEMMADEGFYRGNEERLLQQVQLLWRAVRVVLDVGLHTRGMDPEEAVQMLVTRAHLERSNAESEVRRYCARPAYQLCYAVGRRELLRLRDDYRRKAGGQFSLYDFHDRVLTYGGLPVSLIRWGLGVD